MLSVLNNLSFSDKVLRVTSVQARTGARRRAATQQDLLDATMRLVQRGVPISSLSIAEICAEAGVVRTTFYLHFKDKLALVQALAEEQAAWLQATGQAGQRAGAGPDLTKRTVQRTIAGIVDRWVDNHAVLSAIIETAEHDPQVREIWTAAIREVAAVAANVFARHWQERPALTPENPDVVAEVLTWMIERSCHQIARDPATADDVAGALSDVIWRTLHPAPASN
jgi:AcrR family transcriptional regulator